MYVEISTGSLFQVVIILWKKTCKQWNMMKYVTSFMGIFVLPKQATTSSQKEFPNMIHLPSRQDVVLRGGVNMAPPPFCWKTLNWTRPLHHSPRISPGTNLAQVHKQKIANMTGRTTWWKQSLAAMQFLFHASCHVVSQISPRNNWSPRE